MNCVTYLKDIIRIKNNTIFGKKALQLSWLMDYCDTYNYQVPDGFVISTQLFLTIINEYKKQSSDNELKNRENIIYFIKNNALFFIEKLDLQVWWNTFSKNANKFVVRSSGTIEDGINLSCAGQFESILHIDCFSACVGAIIQCLCSPFLEHAYNYYDAHKISYDTVHLAIIIQIMVPAKTCISGVMFTLFPDTGTRSVITINYTYGLADSLVQGEITPNEYIVAKQSLENNTYGILEKKIFSKNIISEDDIHIIAKMALCLEKEYQKFYNKKIAIDCEWLYDYENKKMYFVQIRPETVYGEEQTKKTIINKSYSWESLPDKNNIIGNGIGIGNYIVAGNTIFAKTIHDAKDITKNDILVVYSTSPDWLTVMKKAGGIVTKHGGRTCHAAIVARELQVPAVIGIEKDFELVTSYKQITIDCNNGIIYNKKFAYAFSEEIISLENNNTSKIMCTIAHPENALRDSALPYKGVGLMRLEFILNNHGIHPNAIIHYNSLSDALQKKICEKLNIVYTLEQQVIKNNFIKVVSNSIAMIAHCFAPHEVIIRFSDFKTHEYKNLIGGELFEHFEENPMIGLRGASRYLDESYKDAFLLECEIIKKVRDFYGCKNISIMIPFVRTVCEIQKIKNILVDNNVIGESIKSRFIMMLEVPSNVILLEKFGSFVDGFSIGSNDLTQLILGVDRDSGSKISYCNETDEAITTTLIDIIQRAHAIHKYIGICGQAPADYPQLAQLLIDCNIDTISLQYEGFIQYCINKNSRHSQE